MKISEFAERIDVFTTQFEAHIFKHGLEDKIVDMKEPKDCRQKGLPLCRTPACHGGEIAIMYDELGVLAPDSSALFTFYELGAKTLANELGMSDVLEIGWLISIYLGWGWGNDYSEEMFHEPSAFLTPEEYACVKDLDYEDIVENFSEGINKNTTLTKILNHWKLFSKRIKERALTNDFNIPEEYLLKD